MFVIEEQPANAPLRIETSPDAGRTSIATMRPASDGLIVYQSPPSVPNCVLRLVITKTF